MLEPAGAAGASYMLLSLSESCNILPCMWNDGGSCASFLFEVEHEHVSRARIEGQVEEWPFFLCSLEAYLLAELAMASDSQCAAELASNT